jgi:hypothetical protein
MISLSLLSTNMLDNIIECFIITGSFGGIIYCMRSYISYVATIYPECFRLCISIFEESHYNDVDINVSPPFTRTERQILTAALQINDV